MPEPTSETPSASSSAFSSSSSSVNSAIPSAPHAFSTARTHLIAFLVVGIAAGLLSGLFGVGGGTIIVPGLLLCGLGQRRASATSLAAMPLASLGGIISYAISGNVNWAMGVLVIIGSISGAVVGARLLQKLREKYLRWAFAVFVLIIIVQQFFAIPTRSSHVDIHIGSAIGMIPLGMVAGLLAALLGVGGGAVLVPGMSVLFGASDLVSRGTSLLAIMPGAISGTVSNLRAGLVDIRAAVAIGGTAVIMAPVGGYVASLLTPQWNQWCFLAFLVIILVKSVQSALKK